MKAWMPYVGGGLLAALAVGTYGGSAQADPRLSGRQLVPTVTTVQDVRVFYRNARNTQPPQPGKGADRIHGQGICFKGDGTLASLARLPRRQAWSTQMIGRGESRGLITIVTQYRSARQAKAKLAQVRALLADCPANVLADGTTITQSWQPLAQMYRGRAVATFSVVNDPAGQDSLQYVAIRQTGALLSFVRFNQAFEGAQPNGAQFTGMVTHLSGKVAERYRALRGA